MKHHLEWERLHNVLDRLDKTPYICVSLTCNGENAVAVLDPDQFYDLGRIRF